MVWKAETEIHFDPHITLWPWLFASPASPLTTLPASQIRGYHSYETGTRISYIEVATLSSQISTSLQRTHGLQAGDTVSILGGNSQWWPVGMFAALHAGCVVSGASPVYGVEEMTYALRTVQSRVLFTLPEHLPVALQAAEKAGMRREAVFLLEGKEEGFRTLKEVAEEGERFGLPGQMQPWKAPEGVLNRDITAFLSFSSGTTGLPKAVMISHQNIMAQVLQVMERRSNNRGTMLAALPFFHIMGLISILHLPVMFNSDVIMVRNFSLEAMLGAVEKYQIKDVIVVPPLVLRMVRDPVVKKFDLSHIRTFICGAAPLRKEVITRLAAMFPNAVLKQGYGMTETTSALTAMTESDARWDNACCVGKLMPSAELRLLDSDGNEVTSVGQPGEILARGPNIVRGYLNNPAANAETFLPDGWLRTGDQAVVDKDGFVTITDRIKELIKVNGVQVAPAELEDLLLNHPEVEDCAVVGVHDDKTGEAPYAFIVQRGSEGRNRKELADVLNKYVQENKHKTKWLRGGVEFVEVIPKSPTGKIIRKDLRKMLKDRAEKAAMSKL